MVEALDFNIALYNRLTELGELPHVLCCCLIQIVAYLQPRRCPAKQIVEFARFALDG